MSAAIETGHYRLEARSISRSAPARAAATRRATAAGKPASGPRSAVAAAAYRHGAVLIDERTGAVHDYSRRRGIVSLGVLAPVGCEWTADRSELWNRADAAEKRKDAKLARDWVLSLPYDLDDAAHRRIVVAFSRYLADRYNVAVDAAIHPPSKDSDSDKNFHAHVMTTTRVVTPDGFGPKVGILDNPTTSGAEVEHAREIAAALINAEHQAARTGRQVDHRSYARQGIDRLPTKKMGQAATALERRSRPVQTRVGDWNRGVQLHNAVAPLRAERAILDHEIAALRQAETRHAQAAAARAREALLAPAPSLARLAEFAQPLTIHGPSRAPSVQLEPAATMPMSTAVAPKPLIRNMDAEAGPGIQPLIDIMSAGRAAMPGGQASAPTKQVPPVDRVLALICRAGGGDPAQPELRFRRIRTENGGAVAALAGMMGGQRGARYATDETTGAQHLVVPIADVAASAGTSRMDTAAMLRVLRRARGASDAAELRAAREVERTREDRAAREAALEQIRRLEAQEKARERRSRAPTSEEVDAVFARVLQAEPGVEETPFVRAAGDTNGPVARLEQILANRDPLHPSNPESNGSRGFTVPASSMAGIFWDALLRDVVGARKWLAELVRLLRAARRASRIMAERARQAVEQRLTPPSVSGSPTRPDRTKPRAVPAMPIPAAARTPDVAPEQPARAAVVTVPARTAGTGGPDRGEAGRDEATRQVALRARKAAEKQAAEQRRLAEVADQAGAEMPRRAQPAQPTSKAERPSAIVGQPSRILAEAAPSSPRPEKTSEAPPLPGKAAGQIRPATPTFTAQPPPSIPAQLPEHVASLPAPEASWMNQVQSALGVPAKATSVTLRAAEGPESKVRALTAALREHRLDGAYSNGPGSLVIEPWRFGQALEKLPGEPPTLATQLIAMTHAAAVESTAVRTAAKAVRVAQDPTQPDHGGKSGSGQDGP